MYTKGNCRGYVKGNIPLDCRGYVKGNIPLDCRGHVKETFL